MDATIEGGLSKGAVTEGRVVGDPLDLGGEVKRSVRQSATTSSIGDPASGPKMRTSWSMMSTSVTGPDDAVVLAKPKSAAGCPPGPLRSWISRIGPRWLTAEPERPMSLQKGDAYRATTLVIAPIHTGVRSAVARSSDGRSGLKRIADTASAGGSATTTWSARSSSAPSESWTPTSTPVGCTEIEWT